MVKRGALIVLEGCDRSGKTTQSKLLVDFLKNRNIDVQHMNFPVRETPCGQIISSYLKSCQNLSDETIHLLFSVNRWEYKNKMKEALQAGTTLVVDRYAYSGVAYSAAKGLNLDWCKNPDRGLIRPDLVFYLKTSIESLTQRNGFGDERYEKSDFQLKVASIFEQIYKEEASYWLEINCASSIENIRDVIASKALNIIADVQNKPLEKLWTK